MHVLYLYSTDISPTIEHGFEDDLEQLVEKATSRIKNQNHGNPYLSGFDAKALGADLEKGVKSAMKKQMVKKGDDIVPEQVKTIKSFPNGLKASLDWQGEKWNSSKPTLNDEGKYPVENFRAADVICRKPSIRSLSDEPPTNQRDCKCCIG